MTRALNLVVIGLSLSSSWGNGHAVTWRALLAAAARRGSRILFLEQEQPWYAAHRDLSDPDFCRLEFYKDPADLDRWAPELAAADAVVIGSYTPRGGDALERVRRHAGGVLAFYDIDTPVTLAALEAGTCAYLRREDVPVFDVYFSFTGGPTLTRLERRFGARAARALYCSVDPQAHRPDPQPPRWDLSYLGTYSPDRQETLERLLIEPARRAPERRFVVAGPQYPTDIVWPDNVERLDHVPPEDHPDFYGRSRLTLNVTRADMRAAGHSPSIRLFEAAACAAPVISDAWAGLDEFFEPGREILIADGPEAVLRALARRDGDLLELGAAARARVLRAHTGERRAETFERELLAARERASGARPGAATRRVPSSGAPRMTVKKPLRILVAGGAGFLGSHLCDRLLSEGHEVTCVDSLLTGRLDNLEGARRRPRFDFVKADIVQPLPARVSGRRFDRIYNLACAASPPLYQADPEHTLLTSVVGTRNLLKLAEASGARFLLTSTSEVYGDPLVHPQSETYWGNVNATGPRACYDEGKRCAETLTFDYDRGGRGEVRVARIFNTYGPRLNAEDGRVVSTVVAQALAGEPITVFGDGSQTRSFCYVDDLIDGLIRLMEHEGPQPGPVNLGNPAELTVRELVDLVLELTGSGSEVVRRPLPVDDPKRRRPDISRAGALLGWAPATSLRQGLKATIAWFEGQTDLEASETSEAALTA